jgi:homoserine O-succinyltransferase
LVVLNQGHAEDVGSARAGPAGSATERRNGARSSCVEIGLINNMADVALRSTERQFIDLLTAASGEGTVRLHFFTLPGFARGNAAAAHLRAAYANIRTLKTTKLDGLIVTGCEPRTERLSEEPYWQHLTDVIDWAEHNTASTIWSCLAAHAAVLHLDGVERHRLAKKCSGVFECAPVADHPLLANVPAPLRFPHSRWNELSERELTAHGYHVLTRSPVAGVDIFTKRWQSLFVFLQGHPEYSADALMREYRRDVSRFLRGESERYPGMPIGYFDTPTEARLAAFAADAAADRDPSLLVRFPTDAALGAGLIQRHFPSGVRLIANWLAYLAACRQEGIADER